MKIPVFLLLAAGLLAGCGQCITGQVQDRKTGNPIFWAKVTAYQQVDAVSSATPKKIGSAHTELDGKFYIYGRFDPEKKIKLTVLKEAGKYHFEHAELNPSITAGGGMNLGVIRIAPAAAD